MVARKRKTQRENGGMEEGWGGEVIAAEGREQEWQQSVGEQEERVARGGGVEAEGDGNGSAILQANDTQACQALLNLAAKLVFHRCGDGMCAGAECDF